MISQKIIYKLFRLVKVQRNEHDISLIIDDISGRAHDI